MTQNYALSKTYTYNLAPYAAYPDADLTKQTDGVIKTAYVAWYNINNPILLDVVIDLVSPKILSYVRFHTKYAAFNRPPDSLIVYGSNNGSDYTQLGSFVKTTDWQYSTGEFWSNNLSVEGTYRYIKFAYTTAASGNYSVLDEIEVYADSAGAPSKPTLVTPADASTIDDTDVKLGVYVTDPSSLPLEVKFYDGDDVLLGTNSSVTSGTNTYFLWENRAPSTEYTWYATAGNGEDTTTSDKWTFTTTARSFKKLFSYDDKLREYVKGVKVSKVSTTEFNFPIRTTYPGTFAEIYVADGSTAQSITNGATYVKLTGFATNGQSSNCTADASNDKITITKAGRYLVTGSINGSSGTANVTFRFAVFLDGTEQNNVHTYRKFQEIGDNCGGAFSGIIDVTSANLDIDLRARHDNGGAVNFTPVYMTMNATYLGET